MIIKMPIIQIENYWEVIKFAATQADAVEEKNISNYCINLLYEILNETALVLLSFDKDKKIHRLLIINFIINKESNKKGMFFKCLYGFESGTDESWLEDSQKIYDFAKKENCEFITMTTVNPQIEKLALTYGFQLVSKNYQIQL